MRATEAWVVDPKELGTEKLAALVGVVRSIVDQNDEDAIDEIREALSESGLMVKVSVEEFIRMHTTQPS